MADRFAILVEGIEDSSLVTYIESTIRDSFHEMALPGSWRVTVRPSRVGGRWDFSVHGLGVRHTLSITVPPILLPSLIPRRLGESLSHLCSITLKDRAPRTLERARGPRTESDTHRKISRFASSRA